MTNWSQATNCNWCEELELKPIHQSFVRPWDNNFMWWYFSQYWKKLTRQWYVFLLEHMFFLGGWKKSWLGLNLAVEKDRREWSYLIGYQFRSTTFVTGVTDFEPPTHKIHQKPGRYVIVGTKNLQYVKLCMVRCLLSSWKLELDKKWRSMIVLLLGFCLRCLEKSKTYCPKWWCDGDIPLVKRKQEPRTNPTL